MKLELNISAGQFFDLIRPAIFVISALLSTGVFYSALRRRFSLAAILAWVVGTLVLPFVFFPLYLVALILSRRRGAFAKAEESRHDIRPLPGFSQLVPLLYLLLVLSIFGLYFYRDYNSVDAHLARATHARLSGNRERTIREYQAALALEDNSHTRKLLAIELANAGFWTEALGEFRLAERGGDPDHTISFRISGLLEILNHPGEAKLEYERFLASPACAQDDLDSMCELARTRVEVLKSAIQ